MTPDQQLGLLSQQAYSLPATVETEDAHALIRERDDGVVMIAPRGTVPTNWIDLWRDVSAIQRRNDPILGHGPDSILADCEQLAWRLYPLIRDREVWMGGHSKGGGEGQGLAAIFLQMGVKVTRLTTFAALRMGALGGIISSIPGFDFVFDHDKVPQEPPNELIPRIHTVLPWTKPQSIDPLEYHSLTNLIGAIPS